MALMVDTSVWSLLLRRGGPVHDLRVRALQWALQGGERVVTTGLILQELFQGFAREASRERILEAFRPIEMIQPNREDHIAAARLRDSCRSAGVQLSTIDALIAQLCIGRGLALLTTDRDFTHAAEHCELVVWGG